MSNKHSAARTDEEWLQVITECRQSGLSDAAWCALHDIPKSTFYNAVVRLRKQACQIPEHSGKAPALDLTAPKEPVEIHVVDKPAVHTTFSAVSKTAAHLDNSHMIEIAIGTAVIKVRNGSDPVLLQSVIMALGRLGYAG